jgi:hypothetical protein
MNSSAQDKKKKKMVLLCFPSSGGKKKQVLLGFRSSEQKKKHCNYNVFMILWFGGKNKCVWGVFSELRTPKNVLLNFQSLGHNKQ